jgi:hypothetical protein
MKIYVVGIDYDDPDKLTELDSAWSDIEDARKRAHEINASLAGYDLAWFETLEVDK